MNARSIRAIPFFLALAWGFNWPAVKISLAAFPPFTLRMIGLGCGALLLLAIAAAQRKTLVPPKESWRGVLIAGFLSVAVFNVATAFAQLNTSTSRAAVLTFTMPMMSALLSWLFVGERLDRRKVIALVIGMLGIAVLAWPVLLSLTQVHDERALKGLVYPLIAAFGWSAGTVYLQRWPVKGDRMVITVWQLLVGALFGAIGAVVFGENLPSTAPSLRVWIALVTHIVAGTALAYWLWFVMSERVSATVSSMTTLMVPVVGVTSAMLLVGDRPSIADWCGFLLVLAGAAMIVLKLDLSGEAARRPLR